MAKANSAHDDDAGAEMVLLAMEQALVLHGEEEHWYLDSGAMAHIMCKKKWLHDYVSIESEAHNLILGDDYKCCIHGYRTICTTVNIDGKTQWIAFAKVLYTPNLAKNLISMACIAAKGNEICIHGRRCDVLDQAGCKILHTT